MPRRVQYAPEDLFEIEQEKLRRLSSVPQALPTQLSNFNRLEPEEIQYHKVTGNESIGTIAAQYGTTPMALVGANPSMQGAPPAGSFVRVPRLLPSTQAPFQKTAESAQYQAIPQAVTRQTFPERVTESIFNFVGGLFNKPPVNYYDNFAAPPELMKDPALYPGGPKAVSGAGGSVIVPAVYASEKDTPTVEAATKGIAFREERAQREQVYYQGAILRQGISLAAQDYPITSWMETGVMPTFVPGNMVGFLPMITGDSGTPVNSKDLLGLPLAQGGYGGVWNPVRLGWDLPSTAPGAKLTPGMALNSQWERFNDTNTVDLNVMPYFISFDELAIPGYRDEEWSSAKNLKKLGGVLREDLGGYIFPKSNNAPDNPLYPSPSPSGGGNGEPIYKPKRRGGGGGGGGGDNVSPTNVNANAVQLLNPENQKLFDKVMAREVDSETAIKQLEWFTASGYLSQDQTILAEQELERLRIAKRLAMLSSYRTASNIWRIG